MLHRPRVRLSKTFGAGVSLAHSPPETGFSVRGRQSETQDVAVNRGRKPAELPILRRSF
jgi:hypothetical protein